MEIDHQKESMNIPLVEVKDQKSNQESEIKDENKDVQKNAEDVQKEHEKGDQDKKIKDDNPQLPSSSSAPVEQNVKADSTAENKKPIEVDVPDLIQKQEIETRLRRMQKHRYCHPQSCIVIMIMANLALAVAIAFIPYNFSLSIFPSSITSHIPGANSTSNATIINDTVTFNGTKKTKKNEKPFINFL